MNGFIKTMLVVAIVGALNWGLVGIFNWNLVDAIFGGGAAEQTSGASRFVYVLVGLSGLIGLLLLPRLHDTAPPARPRTSMTPNAPRV
jgi:hypothetical protein